MTRQILTNIKTKVFNLLGKMTWILKEVFNTNKSYNSYILTFVCNSLYFDYTEVRVIEMMRKMLTLSLERLLSLCHIPLFYSLFFY